MFDHVTLRASDGAASTRFYELVLATLGAEKRDGDGWTAWGRTNSSCSRSLRPRVDCTSVSRLARASGPGEREYHEGYYAAFVLDPDGNNIEVANHN